MTHTSPHLVSVVSKKMRENGWTAADVEAMPEEQQRKFFKREDQKTPPAEKKESIYAQPDYDALCKELTKPGVTQSLLHEEYVEECARAGLVLLQLTQFKVHLREQLKKKPFSEIIHHKPGDETEVDWTGDPARWTDPDTGETVKGWLFVGVLPFSGYGYAEVFPDMKLPNRIMAHVHMYDYFGGTTRVLVCDNLKTGVIEHPITGEVILRKDYEAFANYYGIITFTIGRKNWMFADTERGAQASAVIYSIVETAKAYDLRLYDYLGYLLEELPKVINEGNNKIPDRLLPWSEELPARLKKNNTVSK